ncbi:MAG: TonB-dependent receptor [Gammaproteobacteria bacterium]|nr:TonB-dependent receptor [Gammaproteobacteria bacterium]
MQRNSFVPVLSISSLVLSILVFGAPTAGAQALEEIVVTAQRREQQLNDVPISISAFGQQQIKDLGYVDVTEVARQTPNLDVKYTWGNSMPVYTIRGVGMNSFQASDTSSVGLYVDDVFQTSVATMGAFLYDIERVEVLKGPQGTLFGRNTNGGAVNYLTRAPSMEEASGYVRADYARFDRVELEAAFGGRISDNWAARGSLMTLQQSEGVVFDRTSGQKIGEVDIWAVRGQLLYQPSDDFSARVIVFASTDQSQPVYFQHFGTLDGAFSATPCQAFREGRLDPNTCFDLLGYSDTDGDPYAGDYTDDFDTEINSRAHLDNENVGATLHVDKAFGSMDFRSVTSFQTYDRFQPKESDGTEALFVDFLFASEISAWSQEFRLASSTEGTFSWIVGLQVSGDDVEEKPDRIGYLDDLGVRYGLRYRQERFNAGLYAQGVWQLNDQWRLEVGGRAVYDDVDFAATTYIDVDPDPVGVTELVVAGCPDPAGVIPLDCQLDETAVTGKIGLDWSPNEDLLIYGSVSSGYKPGGFNGGLNTNSELYTPFDEEEVIALELGLKATLWDGRAQLNAAIFDYDYDGLQASTARPAQNQAGVLTFLTNLETADITGAEAEFRVKLSENVELNLGASVLDTKNNDPGANFDGPYDFNDSPRRLANAPENTFNISLGWDIPMNNGSRFRLFTDYNYEGDHYNQIVNARALETTNSLWNARFTWFSSNENLSVALYGKNLTDEVYRVDDLGAGGGLGWGVLVNGMPRVYGISANFSF